MKTTQQRIEHYHHYAPETTSNIRLLTCAFLAALTTGGVVYSFGLYGAELKSTLQLSQSQLDTISSSNFCAGLLSWIPGLMVDHLGVRLSLILGGTLGALFMTIYWAVARQLLAVPPDVVLPLLCGLGVLIFMTNSLVTGSVFKLIVATCAPHTKGSIVGAAKGYVGLGSGLYACLFRALRTAAVLDLDFLLMSAILAVLAVTLPAWILLPSREQLDNLLEATPILDLDQTTAVHLRCLYGGLVLLASMVVGTTLVSLFGDDYDSDVYKAETSYNTKIEPIPQEIRYGRIMVILIAWIGPILMLLVVPPKSKLFHENNEYDTIEDVEESLRNDQQLDDDDDDDDDEEEDLDEFTFKPLVKTNSSPALAYGADIIDTNSVPRGMLGKRALRVSSSTLSSSGARRDLPNYTLTQMLRTLPAWLFAWITVIRVGSGTMVTNNLGQMVESLKLPKHTTTPAALALFSVAQAVSRVGTGALSDWALSWEWVHEQFTYKSNDLDDGTLRLQLTGLPRPAFLIVASLAGSCAHIFMSLTTTRNLFLVGICFAGAAFGTIWPLMVLIVGEVFGTRNIGQNYMFYDGLAGALGTLLLSKYVTQTIYEDHIPNAGVGDDDELDGRTCFGRSCFFLSHIIIACLSFSCALASYWFYCSTRHVYASRVRE
eukprot:CAMPEP_0178816162 /NCGR_PEP_ID=MMETSP0746-20121128/1205_1 /TAXON_ID=913974 /ORGANISM="Nitzschia punctata, Strain CCMP561" /LENGTH=657 /DNA_ID=CAMNT_0020477169 /DNA_START=155 /DNA_END=2128 /DNA_ORIENTATION=+